MRAYEQMTDLMCHDMTENASFVPMALSMELSYGAVEHIAVSSCSICCKERNAENVLILPLGPGHDTEVQVVWIAESAAAGICQGADCISCVAGSVPARMSCAVHRHHFNACNVLSTT